MKMNLTIPAVAAAFAAVLLAGSACQRRPLFLAENRARLELTIHDTLPEIGLVACGNLYETRLYDKSTGRLAETSYTGLRGGEINVPAGSYDLVCCTFDTESVVFSEEDRKETLTASTNPAYVATADLYRTVVRAADLDTDRNLEALPVCGQPDPLFSATVRDLVVPFRDESDETFVIAADAWPMFRCGRVLASGVTGQEYLSGATAFLSGVAAGCSLADGCLLPDPSVLNIPLDKIPGQQCLQASFNTFGFLPETANHLFLLLTDTEGGRYLFHFDVTDQCSRNRGVVIIRVDLDFDVPEPAHGGGGFSPSVDDWNVVIHPVNL